MREFTSCMIIKPSYILGSVFRNKEKTGKRVFCTYSSDIIFLPDGSRGPFLLSGTGKH